MPRKSFCTFDINNSTFKQAGSSSPPIPSACMAHEVVKVEL
ncbi:hypothetical protein NC652_035138 [Populus alba x Populus x berolinensis]|uniref:Uncharacterized protein n=1 Tax=Populus alba x Populus x berolinensis TaxID=444605 RepID=A0AAD6PYJ0_9ROSI|nr:hypothetical protein NC652_035138 [Populus alba x Populus x berolinensis]KAJ6970643.1 hypothetical protein NC653_035046 [Populus alba x Populus x berolinensis]